MIDSYNNPLAFTFFNHSLEERINTMDVALNIAKQALNRTDQTPEFNFPHSELTAQIIGCAMTVHSKLGGGFLPAIYRKALAIEMSLDGLHFDRDKEVPVVYAGDAVGCRSVDFIVENLIIIEIKSSSRLKDVEITQAKNYLNSYGAPIGLLLNFGAKDLEFKRVYGKHPPVELVAFDNEDSTKIS